MLLRTQLRLAALLPVVLAAIVGVILWVAERQIEESQSDAELAGKVRVANFELNVLTQEYLLYGGVRVENQLRTRHRSMGQLLAELRIEGPEEHELVEALRRNHEELANIYELLLGRELSSRQQVAGALLVKYQDTRAKADRLVRLQREQAFEVQRTANILVAGSLVVEVALILILLTQLVRRLIVGIVELRKGMLRVAGGDLDHRLPALEHDELSALAQSFNNMSDRLQASDASIRSLLTESRRLTTDLEQRQTTLNERNAALRKEVQMREQLELELRQRQSELRELYLSLQTTRENERQRLARELHDDLGHILTAMMMDLNWIEAKLPRDQTLLSSKLAAVIGEAEQIVDTIRRIMNEQSPAILGELGLVPALAGLVESFARKTGTLYKFETNREKLDLPSDLEIVLFRIVQECLDITSTHIGATELLVRLDKGDSEIVMVIESDGKAMGDAAQCEAQGLGMLGIRERVSKLNGSVSDSAEPEKGFHIEVTIPIEKQISRE